jgi:hypothetical protein
MEAFLEEKWFMKKSSFSHESTDEYFENHIRPVCVDGKILNCTQLKKLGHYSWIRWLYENNKTPKQYALEKWLSVENLKKIKYNTKELLEQYFEDNIRKHCDNGVMISQNALQKLWFGWWQNSIYIYRDSHGYLSLSDFARKNGLEQHPNSHTESQKEFIDTYFEKHIRSMCKNNRMISVGDLEKNYLAWFRRFIRTKNETGYTSIADFAIKNGLKPFQRGSNK